MKKGYILTLLTVSFAFAQVAKSFGEAPIIRQMPDIVIGDLESVTGSATEGNLFVFPDALDSHNLFVSDDTLTDSEQVKWTFFQVSGLEDIQINGVPTLDGIDGPLQSTSDPILPPTSRQINANNDDPGDLPPGPAEDGDPFTWTFRNATRSPLPANTRSATPAAGTQVGALLDTASLMVFASDDTTASFKTMFVYTVNDTTDSFSGGFQLALANGPYDFTAGTQSWTSLALHLGTGNPDPSAYQNSTSGLCVSVDGANGAQIAGWFSPTSGIVQLITLVDSEIYRVLWQLTNSQTDGNKIPFMTFAHSSTTAVFGGERYFIGRNGDHQTGIGIPAGIADGKVQQWVAPLAVSQPTWSAEIANPANTDTLKFGVSFSAFNANPNIVFSQASGTLCAQSVDISRGDVDDLPGAATLFSQVPDSGNSILAVGGALDDATIKPGAPSTASFTAGGARFNLAKAGGNTISSPVRIGKGAVTGVLIPTNGTIAWSDDKLIEFNASMVKASDTGDTVNAIIIQYLSSNTELGGNDNINSGSKNGDLDSAGTVGATSRQLRSFFWTHKGPTTAGSTLTPTYALINRADLYFDVVLFTGVTGGDPTVIESIGATEYSGLPAP